DINISNVNLTKPTSYAEVAFPWTFEWAPRQPPAGTRYLFCIYQLDDATKEGCSSEIFDIKYTISSASNTGLKDGDGANFTLQLNKDYAWYVYALGPGYGSIPDPQKDYGISFYFSVVKFVSAVRELPQNSVTTDPRPLPSAAKKPWTLMVYLAGDSNLGDPVECAGCNPQRGPFLQAHYNTLTRIAQFYPAVHIVVLKDLYGDTGTQFCYLRSDGAEDCRELGELDTSHPDTLRDFVGNARANFPSDRTMLVISDHGHAVTGVAIDETTGWKQGTNEPEAISLTPKEIRSALMSALGGSKLDVLYYNVCLFGSFDAAYDARDFANYMVASADVMWVLDVYDRLLPLLTAANTPRTVASGTVDAYTNTVKSRAPGLFISVAAYDLTKVAAVNNRLSQFAIALSDNLNVSRSDINNRRALLQRFDSTGDLLHRDDDVLVDLRHMASVFANPGFPNIAIRTSAAALLSELNNGLIVKNSQISGGNDAGGTINLSNASSGISVLFPTVTASGPSTALTTSYLVGEGTYSNYFAATQWDDFVALYSGIDRGALLADGRNRPARGGWRPVSGAVSGESTLFHRRFVPRMTN
ncbi:MAG TPA: clostripain-related cysteine peptidase, partial [Roseiflexaceae bacterium]|nr:clostripain-related cysteine peptidase [Roseiflexaceae bacterium]